MDFDGDVGLLPKPSFAKEGGVADKFWVYKITLRCDDG